MTTRPNDGSSRLRASQAASLAELAIVDPIEVNPQGAQLAADNRSRAAMIGEPPTTSQSGLPLSLDRFKDMSKKAREVEGVSEG